MGLVKLFNVRYWNLGFSVFMFKSKYELWNF